MQGEGSHPGPLFSSNQLIGHVVRKAQKCVAVEPKDWDQDAHTYFATRSYDPCM